MSQTTHRDLERGNDRDGYRNYPQSAPNQPFQGESNFGDSSGPLFSIYSKAAEDEDNKMVERWQKDADGILIFTGLFSAAVAALLAVTVQDLRPNSQDTSAFYLGNIYGVLADPNASISPVAKPPPFSSPRYAVWVNSLWFLSLVMSVSCALWATSLHQWARRYIRLTQPARCSPEKRARMRAFFANGVDKMHIPWAVEGLPTLLHISLFLFFGGLVIFLFNVDKEVFTCVAGWIGLFSIGYGLVTVLPLIRQDSPYSTPLSIPAWFLNVGMPYVIFKVLAFITSGDYGSYETWERCRDLRDRYRGWMLGGVEKKAEEMVSEQSSKIDVRILGWTISALGDDESLEKFFKAIPGLFKSKLVKHLERDFPLTLLATFWGALDGFIGRTLSSNSITELVKSRRDIICRNIVTTIPCLHMSNNLHSHFSQAPVSIDRLQAMARWRSHENDFIADYARIRVAENLASMPNRNDDWIAFANDAYGLATGDLRDNIAYGGDNVLLATLNDVFRRFIHSHKLGPVDALTKIDIRHTLPGLQHDFCTLWNEIVQEANNPGYYTAPVVVLTAPVYMLREIRHLYIALHQGTNAAPTAFSSSTPNPDFILYQPSSYPLCDIASHHPDSAPHVPVPNPHAVPLVTQLGHSHDPSPHYSTSGGSTISRQIEGASIIPGPLSPSDPMVPSAIGDSSQAPAATSPALPAHTSPHPTDTGAIAEALRDVSPIAALSHPLEGATQRDMVASSAESDMSEILPTTFTPALSLAPSGGIFAANPPPPPHVPPLPNAELLSLLKGSSDNATLPRLQTRILVNNGNMSLANAVLRLLVYCPPFRDLFRDLGRLVGQREGGETDGGTTPLVDATVKFVEEFEFSEKEPPPTQQLQLATGREPREDEEAKKEHDTADSFEPMYMYDAMKERRQLKNLLDGQQQEAEEFFRLYLDALDEEVLALLASAAPEVEEREVSQSGRTDVGKRSLMAESLLKRLFGGKFRSTVRSPNQPDTVTVEGWRSLRLNIQPDSVHTIQDALAHVSQPRPARVGQFSSSVASRRVLLEALPSVLVLHLRQFLYDAAADGIAKTNKPVQFAPELEIPLEIMAPAAGKSAEQAHYKLYGVLYHHGESAGSGHYTVDVLRVDPNGDGSRGETWLHMTNEAVSVVRHEDVFKSRDNERGDDRCVCMLLYCRTASAQT